MGTAASVENKSIHNWFGGEKPPDLQYLPVTHSELDVGRFAKEVFTRSSSLESLKDVLSSHKGRQTYMTFLHKNYDEEDLRFFTALNEMKKSSYRSDENFGNVAESLITSYFSPAKVTRDMLSDELKELMSQISVGQEETSSEKILNVLDSALDVSIAIITTRAATRFIGSPFFSDIMVSEEKSQRNNSKKREQISQNGQNNQNGKNGKIGQNGQNKETGANSHNTTQENSTNPNSLRVQNTLIGSIAKSIEEGKSNRQSISRLMDMSIELALVIKKSSWLRSIFFSMESLPVCLCLAGAGENMRGFPLIYVNTAFENATGYDRSEILGNNCRFLQQGKGEGDVAEPESVAKLTHALREAQPVKVSITNFKKDGTRFRNLLAMKPVIDENGDYAFVIGIQFVIGDKDASARKLKMVDDLFRMLPDTLEASSEQIFL